MQLKQNCSMLLFCFISGNTMIEPSHATIKIPLPVLPITGQAIVDIALSVLPNMITSTPCLWLLSAATWPQLLWVPIIKPIAFNSPNWAAASLTLRSSAKKKAIAKLFNSADAPLTILRLKELVKGMSSGLFHYGGLGLHRVPILALQFPRALKFLHQHQARG